MSIGNPQSDWDLAKPYLIILAGVFIAAAVLGIIDLVGIM